MYTLTLASYVFTIITLIAGTTLMLIIWKKPALLGTYLHATINQLFKKYK